MRFADMSRRMLILGDALALLLVTAIGFASHGETGASYLPRAAALFVPLAAGWFLLAPAVGLFDADRVRSARQLWRPVVTAFFAAQFAVTLRGLLLNSASLPIFALVMGATSALGMLVWRGIVVWLGNRSKSKN